MVQFSDGLLVQIFENKNLWFDIGYEETDGGDIVDGEEVVLSRTSRSSPEFLEHHSEVDDLIQFQIFDTPEEQTEWLVKSIKRNLRHDELIPEDIVVINPDPLTTKAAVGPARQQLLQEDINSNLAGVTTIADVFTEPGTVTFTGVFRAKGNEAAMVYVINAQDCFGAILPRDVARARNRLFTAITRSKAWVRVLGVGKAMQALKEEFEKVKEESFALKFRYPTEEERKSMMTVNRDMSRSEQERSTRRKGYLQDIVESLESGDSFIEDYPDALMKKLKALLEKKTRRKKK